MTRFTVRALQHHRIIATVGGRFGTRMPDSSDAPGRGRSEDAPELRSSGGLGAATRSADGRNSVANERHFLP